MRLRKIIFLAGAGLLVVAVFPAAAAVHFGTGFQYDSFSSAQSPEEGTQIVTTISLSGGSKKGFYGGLATGYVDASYRSSEDGAEKKTVSTVLDTKVSLFYSASVSRLCLQVGSTFNLPTGKERLNADERLTEMDTRYGELVSVSDYGEGTNANPGFSLVLPWGNSALGVGFSHTFRGPYDPTTDIENDDVDPADQTSGKLCYGWKKGPVKFLMAAKYMAIWPDRINGEEMYKEGDQLSGNAKLEYRPMGWEITLEAAYSTWFKGKRKTADGEFLVEEARRFGDDTVVRAKVKYRVWKRLSVHAAARGHWVQSNEFARSSSFYDGKRTSLAGSVGFRFALLPGVSVSGSVGYQQVEEAADAVYGEDTTYEGFKAALGIETLL